MADLKTTQERRDDFREWLQDEGRNHVVVRARRMAEDACHDIDTLLAENARLRAVAEAQNAADNTPRPLDEWHEDFGPVLWWRFPIKEPPYVGTPNDDDWPVMATATGGTEPFATHWTRLLEPEEPTRDQALREP